MASPSRLANVMIKTPALASAIVASCPSRLCYVVWPGLLLELKTEEMMCTISSVIFRPNGHRKLTSGACGDGQKSEKLLSHIFFPFTCWSTIRATMLWPPTGVEEHGTGLAIAAPDIKYFALFDGLEFGQDQVLLRRYCRRHRQQQEEFVPTMTTPPHTVDDMQSQLSAQV